MQVTYSTSGSIQMAIFLICEFVGWAPLLVVPGPSARHESTRTNNQRRQQLYQKLAKVALIPQIRRGTPHTK